MRTLTIKDLVTQVCVPCRGGMPSLKGTALRDLVRCLGHQWKVVEGHHLEKEFRFKDFRDALAFVNRVGKLAEAQGHHPDLYLAWGQVKVTIWTHKANGLTESDFVLAAKIEESERTRVSVRRSQ